MKIAFLGRSTDDKRFLLLCLAKIAAIYTNVTIFTKYPYDLDNADISYDYCGIKIVIYKDDNDFLLLSAGIETVFLDAEDIIELPEDYRAISICEPTRRQLEFCVRLAREYACLYPSRGMSVIYYNILEYGKVGKKFMDLYWEQALPNSARITFSHSIYFEEINRTIMIDSQYSNRLLLKSLSLAFKSSLKGIIQDIFALDTKTVKEILKKAEREK